MPSSLTFNASNRLKLPDADLKLRMIVIYLLYELHCSFYHSSEGRMLCSGDVRLHIDGPKWGTRPPLPLETVFHRTLCSPSPLLLRSQSEGEGKKASPGSPCRKWSDWVDIHLHVESANRAMGPLCGCQGNVLLTNFVLCVALRMDVTEFCWRNPDHSI
jgi:hypothetical protein